MANKNIYTGIDIGTYHVKVVIAARPERADIPMQILGTGTAASRGMRQGYILNVTEASRSIQEALARATSAAGVEVKRARVSIGGLGLDDLRSTGEITLTQSAGSVSGRDIDRCMRESEKRALARLGNRTIVHTFPLAYRVDNMPVYGRPQGWHGTKLAVDTLIVSALSQHYEDLIDAVEGAGVEVEDKPMAAPIAASLVTLNKAQKTAGVVLANIGAETISIAVFENDEPLSVKVLPKGSADITSQIALNFRLPLNEAEAAKRGALTGSNLPQKKLEKVIVDQLKDMFELINAHLKEIGKQRLLPAGVVITGGGSSLTSASEVARAVLKLPSSIGALSFTTRAGAVDATWAVAYGLCRWGYALDADPGDSVGGIGELWRDFLDWFKKIFRNMMP